MASAPSSSPSENVRRVTNSILSTAAVLLREGNRLFRDTGITSPQFNALKLLAEASDGLRPSELAAALVVDPSSVTFILKQLEKKGWIVRREDASDRRARLVAISEEGKIKYVAAESSYRLALQEIAGEFSPGQLEAAIDIIERIRESAATAVDRIT
jgi:MarR family transcriptional regulator for hemolysin